MPGAYNDASKSFNEASQIITNKKGPWHQFCWKHGCTSNKAIKFTFIEEPGYAPTPRSRKALMTSSPRQNSLHLLLNYRPFVSKMKGELSHPAC